MDGEFELLSPEEMAALGNDFASDHRMGAEPGTRPAFSQLAQAAGVDLDLLREVGDSNGQLSRMALAFFDLFRQRGAPEIWPPVEKMLRGSTAIARKDLSCAMAMARESGVDDSALARVRERMGEIYGVEPAGPGRGSA